MPMERPESTQYIVGFECKSLFIPVYVSGYGRKIAAHWVQTKQKGAAVYLLRLILLLSN